VRMIEQIEPEHRCKKCKTPLNFQSNYGRDDKEIDEMFNQTKGFWKRLMFDKWSFVIDTNRQHWNCPKCFESYLVKVKQ
jgi:ribosomal protein L37AE/L43A